MRRLGARSLRARLTTTYVVALAIGLVVFAAFSLTVIEEVSKAAVDSRMGASARAFVGSLAVENGEVKTDFAARRRLRAILSPQQNAAIIRHDGTILMQSGAIPPQIVAIVKDVNEGPQFASVRADGTPLRILTMTIPGVSSEVVVLWRAVDFISDYRRTGLLIFSASILVIVLAAYWIGSLVARRGLEPLRRMAEGASEIEGHDLSRRLTTTMRDDELAQFCAAFNRMLDRLQHAFDQQQQFTADASHELRAPLAVIRAETDLALRRMRDVESYRAAMVSIQAEVAHLEALIEAFLIIARTDAGLSETKYVDVSRLANQAAARMERFAGAKDVHVKREIVDGATVMGDPGQLERILEAVLHNAIKFGRTAGSVEIAVERTGAEVTVFVRDDGPGFSPEARTHAFERFWRGRTVDGAAGSGLGLTIAKSAIERWGGRIDISNLAGGGGQIAIVLPAGAYADAIGTA
ncbi:MAG TPA: ATP-binding protein [Candidatus Acidoferrales bacterium]|nr:ATP-binding protein [Candidatus Acidoferrales bacterium]